MRKNMRIVCIICLLIVFTVSGCSSLPKTMGDEPESTSSDNGETSENSEETSEAGEESDMEKENRRILAKALGKFEKSSSVSNIIGFLDVINAGKLQSAKAGKNGDDPFLDIVAEDGTNYHILLSRGGNVEAIQNVDTGEWVVQSYQ